MESKLFMLLYDKCKFILWLVRFFEYLGNCFFGVNNMILREKKLVYLFLKKYEVGLYYLVWNWYLRKRLFKRLVNWFRIFELKIFFNLFNVDKIRNDFSLMIWKKWWI